MFNYTDKDREALKLLASDPRKVQVMCDMHMYCGDLNSPPVKGCAECWKAYYFTSLANTPPDQQKQFIDELEAVVRQLVELADKKKFDVAIDAHPTVEFS